MSRLITLSYFFLSLALIVLSCRPAGNASEPVNAGTDPGDVEAEVRSAVLGLYSAISAEDAEAVEEYVRPEGYSEFSKTGSLRRLDMPYIRGVFDRGIDLQFHVEDLKIEVVGDGAAVTGYRIHSNRMEDGTIDEGTQRLSMFWSKIDGKWKLVHVHLSPAED